MNANIYNNSIITRVQKRTLKGNSYQCVTTNNLNT